MQQMENPGKRRTVCGSTQTQRRLSPKKAPRGLVALRLAAIVVTVWGSLIPNAELVSQAATRRLTVRPHELATGTQTTQAGEQPLDSISRGLIYVPQQAVGTRRVPLVVSLTGGGVNARREMDIVRPLADKYGMILLVLDHPSIAVFDAALTQVLRKFTIDPDKIAIGGVSEGGFGTTQFGRGNLDIFSRIAPMSAAGYPPYGGNEPRNANAQMFVSAGIGEPSDMVADFLNIAREERAQGHAVKMVLNIRMHAERVEDIDYMWQWLRDTWATPVTKATPPSAATDIVLTDTILGKMSTFWTRFKKADQDSTRKIVLSAYQKELPLLIGQERVFAYDMVNLPAIASKYAWVAADLKQAGLTLQQEEDYRRAFIGARATKVAGSAAGTIPATSVTGQNLAFLNAHENQFNILLDLMGVPRCETTIQAQFGC